MCGRWVEVRWNGFWDRDGEGIRELLDYFIKSN